ncbi:MAG: hypothetical protein LUD46_11115 [Parabacteroides sp.]|nr:hypothetical protein [Parabacteroides sp.]
MRIIINFLQARSKKLGSDNPLAAIDVKEDTNIKIFTITHWKGTEKFDGNKKISSITLEAQRAGEDWRFKPALDFHNNQCDFIIDGAVSVIANSQDRAAGQESEAHAVFMPNIHVTLKNGAYFAYDNNYNPSHPKKWTLTNFASAGDEAYIQLQKNIDDKTSYTEMTINAGSLYESLDKTTLNSKEYLYGTIDNKHFVVPAEESFKLLVNNSLQMPYGELATTTENVSYPFPINTDNTGDGIQTNVNVGAINAGETYYGLLSNGKGSIALNVTQFPHKGELSASSGDITLKGTEAYKVMKTDADGLTLKTEGDNLLTLSNITINANNKVYIEGNVYLDEIDRCRIAPDVIKFKPKNADEKSVYFCRISTVDTELMGLEAGQITIEGNDNNYPYRVDATASCIYMWLPDGTNELTFKKKRG